ncbi:MAG: TRAP transporter fused permease subunit [candidate division NC10 bacterium]|nr:TRAP transporter fused permease subunit [candidate division NC10 bacterium]
MAKRMRKLSGAVKWAVLAYACAASLFHLYTAGYGSLEPRLMRGIHLLLLLPLTFLLYPATRRSPRDRPSSLDYLAAGTAGAACGYVLWHAERLNFRFQGVDEVLPVEVVLGSLLVGLIIEACRRSLSRWMAATIVVFLGYLAASPYMPGVLHFKGYAFPRMVEIMYLAGDEGIFGFLTGISANILFIYILFAGVMMKAGVGDFLIDFAVWAAGWARGGAAKIAVLASALYGTVSGSTVANVYATGSFTIPLMKRRGFTPKQAAAIEAIAGTGGQIMPPIMGAGAFIMAEVTGVPYFQIIQAAAIPAILYYIGVFSMVHFIALRSGMPATPRAERPSWRPMLRRAYYFAPFLLILFYLAQGYSPTKAAFFVIVVTCVLSFLDRKTWMTWDKVRDALFESAVSAALIAAALAGSGMIVATLTRTGAALAFGGMIVGAARGNLILAMILIFLVVSVLGTGIPTTAAYVIAVTIGAAALGNLGVAVLAAHLFVFYYAVLSDLTPPDAITAFAAANLAGSEMMSTGIEAFKLGIAGFLVPFAFVYQPALLLHGSWLSVGKAFTLTAFGVICLAAALIGFVWRPLNRVQRMLLVVAAVLLVFPRGGLELLGLGLAGGAFAWARAGRSAA